MVIPPAAVAEHGPDARGGPHHLTTLQGWRQFTTAPVAPPPAISQQVWSVLPEADQARHDEDRLDYHTRMAVVATSALPQPVSIGEGTVERRLT